MSNTYSPFDWTNYLVLAEELAKRTGEEAAMRTAISRAYYAAFKLARVHLERKYPNGIAMYKPGAHENVWEHFKRSADTSCKSIANDGDRLKEHRRMADYEEVIVRLPDVLSHSLKIARKMVGNIKSLTLEKP